MQTRANYSFKTVCAVAACALAAAFALAFAAPTLAHASSVVDRLAGATALGTMEAIVDEGYSNGSCSTVIVATQDGYWDALAASGLAGLKGCPVLLTSPDGLSSQTKNEISRLGATKAIIVGGTAAVKDQVRSDLAGMGLSVDRRYGATAVGTAVSIYEAGTGSWGNTCILATSNAYQDALSISPYAYAKRAPIFLSNADGSVSDQVVSAIAKGGFTRVIIVGGEKAITPATENRLKSETSAAVKRIGGANAYDTSRLIAEFCYESGMTGGVAVATGTGYWDALTGAALCGKRNAVIVLADSGNETALSVVSKFNGSSTKAYVFGGSAVVSNSMFESLITRTGANASSSRLTTVAGWYHSFGQAQSVWSHFSNGKRYLYSINTNEIIKKPYVSKDNWFNLLSTQSVTCSGGTTYSVGTYQYFSFWGSWGYQVTIGTKSYYMALDKYPGHLQCGDANGNGYSGSSSCEAHSPLTNLLAAAKTYE